MSRDDDLEPQDRAPLTLDDVGGSLEDITGHLAAIATLLRVQTDLLRTFMDNQVRNTKATQ